MSQTLRFQRVLPAVAAKPTCHYCLHWPGRCDGPTTKGSLRPRTSSEIGCEDASLIQLFDDDLEERMLDAQPARHENLLIPSFVPALIQGMPRGVELPPDRLYGVYLKNVLNKRGDLDIESPTELRTALRLPPEARLALFITATDRLLERAWGLTESRDLWGRVLSLSFEFTTSATFSVYLEDARSDQIYNQKRNFWTHDLFCSIGVPTIPFLFLNPNSVKDYDYILNWMREREDVSKVAMLAHCYRSRTEFEGMLRQMRTLVRDLGRRIEFVIVGAAKEYKIRAALKEFPDSVFVSTQPALKGTLGQRTLPDLEHEAVARTEKLTKDLIPENIRRFDLTIEVAKRDAR